MAYTLKDFSDIVRSVMAELKLQTTDTVSKERIKQDINEIYINEVAPYKRWTWLRKNTRLELKPYYNTGTATVTPDSTTVTLSVAPSVALGSKTGYFFAVNNYDEIYYISAHTAGSDTITLSSPFTGTLSTTATYKIWKDWVALPTNCRETFEVLHRFHTKNLEGVGLQEFRRIVNENPRVEARPLYYTTDDFFDPSTTGDDETESDRYRILRVYPSVYSNSTTLEVDYIQDVSTLSLDADEPLMQISDRIVLKYGALYLAWSRERNPEEANRNFQLFQNKLSRMAGAVEDSFDTPQLTPNNRYILQKRGLRRGASLRMFEGSSGGGSYTSPTYITNATIGPNNNLTGNLTVDSGITIDGRDISADGTVLDSIATLANGYIYVGDANNELSEVALSGHITMDNTGATTITSGVITNTHINNSAAIAYSKLSLADSILDADINSAAAIAYSKLSLADSILNADINSAAAIAYSKLSLSDSILNADINSAAAISFSKLASLTSANILVGNGSNVATAVAVTGDISLSNSGVTAYAGTVPVNKGGTGQTSANDGFNALSPMTTGGDLIYGGASGAATRLANGSAGQILQSNGSTNAPSWSSATTATSSASGSYTNTTTSYTDVTNLSVSITADGVNPIRIVLLPASTSSSYIQISRTTATTVGANIKLLKDGSDLAMWTLDHRSASGDPIITYPHGGFEYLETPAAGTYTYKYQARVQNGSASETIAITNVKMMAYVVR